MAILPYIGAHGPRRGRRARPRLFGNRTIEESLRKGLHIMTKKSRLLLLLLVLVSMLVVNVAQAAAMAAVESDTPCTDAWERCIQINDHTQCDIWWCGCMYGRYGYVCADSEIH